MSATDGCGDGTIDPRSGGGRRREGQRMRTRSAIGRAAACVGAVVLLAGCGLVGGDREVGERVARWSEGDQDWVTRSVPPVLLTDDADREDWIASLPPGAEESMAEVDAVDLDEAVLVIAGYSRCTQESQMLLGEDDGEPVLTFEVVNPEPDVDCGWSPFTIDAWAVPLSAMDGQVPEDVLVDTTSS